MKLWVPVTGAIGVLLTGWMLATAGWSLPPVNIKQTGYRGTGMAVVHDREREAKTVALNLAPPPPYQSSPTGQKAKELYPNLEVLGDLTEDQFNGLMASMAEWIAPAGSVPDAQQGCAYCHNTENMGDYSKYTLKVARRMIQMTRTVNADWKSHVAQTGVTCYTCHRGHPVPQNIWFKENGPGPVAGAGESGWMGWRNGQNVVTKTSNSTSLPYDYQAEFLLGDKNIRVHTLTALPSGNKSTIMDTEHTYALMINMSNGLGVNCVFCHDSRAFNAWDQSPPQRVTAWYGIRLARALNNDYLEPLTSTFPHERLGRMGDAPKVNCATCHQGVNKPLNGASMLKDYLAELGGPGTKTQ
ncbi:MAG: photosynthetic reaction center cytochrome PufC [Alsobacter sp.]